MQADNYQCCAPFMERVSADDVPDYYEIVTNPMDLSTVRSSLPVAHAASTHRSTAQPRPAPDGRMVERRGISTQTQNNGRERAYTHRRRSAAGALLGSVGISTLKPRRIAASRWRTSRGTTRVVRVARRPGVCSKR
jgi:hypothetical protein